jgi:hypothetical protein
MSDKLREEHVDKHERELTGGNQIDEEVHLLTHFHRICHSTNDLRERLIDRRSETLPLAQARKLSPRNEPNRVRFHQRGPLEPTTTSNKLGANYLSYIGQEDQDHSKGSHSTDYPKQEASH